VTGIKVQQPQYYPDQNYGNQYGDDGIFEKNPALKKAQKTHS
jgi:hypothetical protein